MKHLLKRNLLGILLATIIIFVFGGLIAWEQNDYWMPEFDVSNDVNYSKIVGNVYSSRIPLKYYSYINQNQNIEFHHIDGVDRPTTDEMHNVLNVPTGTKFHVIQVISCLLCLPLDIVTFVVDVEKVNTNGYPLRLSHSYYLKPELLIELNGQFFVNPDIFENVAQAK